MDVCILGFSTEYVPIAITDQNNILKNGSLIISHIQKDHEGMYRCNVSNGIGDPLLKTVIVKVIGRYTFGFNTNTPPHC